jgi:hypothetical protein
MRSRCIVVSLLVFCFSTVASAGHTFSDDFDDGDLAGWSAKQGAWSVEGDLDKYLSSNLNYGVIWNEGSFGVNQRLSVDAYFDLGAGNADNIAHLRLRTSEHAGATQPFWDTGYLAQVTPSGVGIYNTHENANPSIWQCSFASVSGGSPITSSGWYTLQFAVTGTGSNTHFELGVNDTLYIDHVYGNSIAQLDSGYIGLGREIKYDNFQGFTDVAPVPVPGAVLLGMIGLSVVGVKLRKHA